MAHAKESRASLCKRTGISKTSLSDFLAGRNDLSFDAVIALISAFPAYNARWLLTGVKSQAMIAHKKALDAAKLVKPAIYPSNEIIITRLKKFSDDNDLCLYISNDKVDNPYAQLCNGDLCFNSICLEITVAYGNTSQAAALALAKALSLKSVRSYGSIVTIDVPDFFAPI